jgi:RimJ/RimL family protein N-acetyltransferase
VPNGAGPAVNPSWTVRTARLVLTPVGGADLADLRAIKADPRVFAIMLGGVRTPLQSSEELAEDVVGWGANGFGMWAIRELAGGSTWVGPGSGPGRRPGLVGVTGLESRPDGRGVALRFALWPEAQGRGLAREAAGAALRFGHDRARLRHIVAVARENNFASRMVLGGIGMTERASFVQQGFRMVMYESVAIPPGPPAGASR